jgi:hypothetical protein
MGDFAVFFYGAACALGVSSGAAYAALWRSIVPRGTGRCFWSSLRGLALQMMSVDETSDFLRCYRRLGGLLAAYLAHRVVVPTSWDGKAERLALVPAAAGEILAGPDGPALRLKGADSALPLAGAHDPTAFCGSSGYCALFSALDFEVLELDAAPKRIPYIVVRADHGDVNPFWPFLSDIEFAFFAAFILSTIAWLLWRGATRR